MSAMTDVCEHSLKPTPGYDRAAWLALVEDDPRHVQAVAYVLAERACAFGHVQLAHAFVAARARSVFKLSEVEADGGMRALRVAGLTKTAKSGDRSTRMPATLALQMERRKVEAVQTSRTPTMVTRWDSAKGRYDEPVSVSAYLLERNGRAA